MRFILLLIFIINGLLLSESLTPMKAPPQKVCRPLASLLISASLLSPAPLSFLLPPSPAHAAVSSVSVTAPLEASIAALENSNTRGTLSIKPLIPCPLISFFFSILFSSTSSFSFSSYMSCVISQERRFRRWLMCFKLQRRKRFLSAQNTNTYILLFLVLIGSKQSHPSFSLSLVEDYKFHQCQTRAAEQGVGPGARLRKQRAKETNRSLSYSRFKWIPQSGALYWRHCVSWSVIRAADSS